MEKSTTQILAQIREIKVFSEGEENLHEINYYLDRGWIIVGIAKHVDDFGNESLVFYLGRPDSVPKESQ